LTVELTEIHGPSVSGEIFPQSALEHCEQFLATAPFTRKYDMDVIVHQFKGKYDDIRKIHLGNSHKIHSDLHVFLVGKYYIGIVTIRIQMPTVTVFLEFHFTVPFHITE
jgi:hypothetical protein